MRKAQKKQVNDFVVLLAEAQTEIKNAVRKKNVPLALDLLEQCQQGAIRMGTLIDNLEGEGHPTVVLLEQYCELVYRLHEELAAGSLKAGADAAEYVKQQLDNVLTEIANSAEKDIPERLEVVFCPYKASMWDSLESVWKAASENVNCDTYVIPIPYYDKNPDGSFREEHYEGLEYPEYVPITYYKSYNFEERKPDVVFIHNPYDNFNYVTSVHPFFYASNLVKYTDKLVYIPYFVLEEVNWDTMTEEAKEKMRAFCIQSGVLNSHKTIVQSEAMKQVYVNLLCKEFGEQHREMWESKILGLGSPKLDKISKMTRENVAIPDEWKLVLDKPDGTRKKVVLYNTGVSALLEHREKMLEKMRNSLHIFYENREQIALLWRPHPLIQATIASMLPGLWTEYEKLLEEYRQAGWGIYDDTADLNRAIALADAYYGDMSSVVMLFKQVKKPVLRQDVSCKRSNLIPIASECYIQVGNCIYLAACGFNGIIRVDADSWDFSYIMAFPEYSLWEERLYNDVICYGDYLVFIPYRASHIAKYNVHTEEIEMFPLPQKDTKDKFVGGVMCEEYILLIPYKYQSFVKFYPESGKLEEIFSLEKIFEDKQEGQPYFEYTYSRDNDNLYLLQWNSKMIFVFNILKAEYSFYETNEISSFITGVYKKEDFFWLTEGKNGRVYKFEKAKKNPTVFDISEVATKNLNYGCIRYKNFIIILPILTGKIHYINMDSDEVKQLDFLSCICDNKSDEIGSKWTQIVGYFFYEEDLFLIDNYSFYIYKLVIKKNEIFAETVGKLSVSKKNLKERYCSKAKKNYKKNFSETLFETSFYSLEEYLGEFYK